MKKINSDSFGRCQKIVSLKEKKHHAQRVGGEDDSLVWGRRPALEKAIKIVKKKKKKLRLGKRGGWSGIEREDGMRFHYNALI